MVSSTKDGKRRESETTTGTIPPPLRPRVDFMGQPYPPPTGPNSRQSKQLTELASLLMQLPKIQNDPEAFRKAILRILTLQRCVDKFIDPRAVRDYMLTALHPGLMAEVGEVNEALERDNTCSIRVSKDDFLPGNEECRVDISFHSSISPAPGRVAAATAEALRLSAARLMEEAIRLETAS